MAGDAEAQKGKSKMYKLMEKLLSVVRVRRGITVDSCTADHVLPTSWLTWIVLFIALIVALLIPSSSAFTLWSNISQTQPYIHNVLDDILSRAQELTN